VRRVAILGSTGSIGVQALDVVRANPGLLSVHSLVCGSNTALLARQSAEFPSAFPAAIRPDVASDGEGILERALDGCDIVLNAITGFAGLRASLMAASRGLPLALANKESLVTGGCLLEGHVARGLVEPVDSEHSTIARCLAGEAVRPLGITLTASGGALRDASPEAAEGAGPAEVLAHPTWRMGPRITVDSATLVNKAFEVLEAEWLFPGIPVDAVLHPQSIAHSLVRLADGSWKALMGTPDMRLPVQYALLGGGAPGLVADDSPADWPALRFGEIDPRRYPAFGLVKGAGRLGGTAPAAANAADEEAVAAFLAGRILFGGIARVIEHVLERTAPRAARSYRDIVDADEEARALARAFLEGSC